MRFVWAVAAFVLAALLIAVGVAQRTIFQGPRTDSVAVETDSGAAYTLIDGAVLTSRSGEQTLRVDGDGPVFMAYGRTADVTAWLSDVAYNAVTVSASGATRSALVTPTGTDDPTATAEASAPASDAAASPTEATTSSTPATAASDALPGGRSPVGSDLWLVEVEDDDLLVTSLQLPAGMSVIVASDGTAPAPAEVAVSWPTRSSTPWAGPLIVLGGIVALVGVVLYVLGIRHVRRSRGPRRKGLPVTPTEPIDLAVEGDGKGVIAAGTPRRSLVRGRRAFVVVPAALLASSLFAGCSGDAWPQLGATVSETTPTPTVIVPEGQAAPAVTEAQARRIIGRIADTVATADEGLDAALAATRLSGAALTERQTNYTLRGAIADLAALPAIPTGELSITLPQASDEWPRTVLAVVDDAAEDSPTMLTMSQADPWSEYTVSYVGELEASAEIPRVAAAYVGATAVPPNSAFLLIPPDELAAAYADVLTNGDNSQYAGLFDAETDDFRRSVTDNRATRAAAFAQTGAQTGTLAFLASAGDQPPVALATAENGAIVAVDVWETDEVKPTTADAVIKVDGNPRVQTLTGVAQSATGFATTFSDQLFFYVPAQSSTEKIRVLGYASNILSAKVL